MLPATIDYILSLRDASGGKIASHAQHQVIIPNFPPVTTINYSIAPADPIQAYILYEFVFGAAMVPHAFDVKIRRGADRILDIIVSGRFTTTPTGVFVVIARQQPTLNVAVTNLRVLTNYYELTTSYLCIVGEENWKIVVDALRRMHTSIRSEELLAQMVAKPPAPPPQRIGGER